MLHQNRGCCHPCPGRSKSLVATENLLENTDGVGAPHHCSLHPLFSRGGTLLPSIYADARYIDAVIVSKATDDVLKQAIALDGEEAQFAVAPGPAVAKSDKGKREASFLFFSFLVSFLLPTGFLSALSGGYYILC